MLISKCLMEYETAGDPMSGLKWTRKTTGKISKELCGMDVSVSKGTVGKILKKLNFSLKSNSKKISNGGKCVKKEDPTQKNVTCNFVILYGVYNSAKNDAFVSIGMFLKKGSKITSGDTPEFAVESIERWFLNCGQQAYSNLKWILILVDAGGSNGYRCHQ